MLVSVADIDALPTLGSFIKHDIPLRDTPPQKMEWPYGPRTDDAVTPPPVPLHPKKNPNARIGRDHTHARGVRKDVNRWVSTFSILF